MDDKRSVKGIRLQPSTQRLLKLLAAYEGKTEATIVEEALPLYLQMRALAYGGTVAERLAHSTPDNVGDIVGTLEGAIEDLLERAVTDGQMAPPLGAAQERLRTRQKERTSSRELVTAS